MKYFKYIYLFFLLHIQLFGASGEGSNHFPHLDGSILTIYWVIPFAGILLSIAIFPLIAPHFWHKNFGKVSLFWTISLLIPLLFNFLIQFFIYL